LHKRFREGRLEVFKKNGVDVMAVWRNLDVNTLVYLLSYRTAPPEPVGPRSMRSQVDRITPEVLRAADPNRHMSATDYSPLK
jgi:hypothetical protein